MSQQAEVTLENVVAALKVLNDRLATIERMLLAPMGQQPQGEPPSVAVRLDGLETALQFAMQQIKVTITQASPIIGGGATRQEMTLLDFYLQQAKQQQMLVGVNSGQPKSL